MTNTSPADRTYADAMERAGCPIHLELLETGGHGMKDCDWFSPAALWLEENKIID